MKSIVHLLALSIQLNYLSCADILNSHRYNVQMDKVNQDSESPFNSPYAHVTRKLASKLLTRLATDSENTENIFLSPFGIAMIYSILVKYTEGKTRKELVKLLDIQDNPDYLASLYSQGREILKNTTQKNENILSFGNLIVCQSGFRPEKEFKKWSETNFATKIMEGDLQSQDFIDSLNKAIERSTHGKISKLYTSPLSEEIEMILSSTIFFKGEWVNQFDVDKTKTQKFTNIDQTKSKVAMMSRENMDAKYSEIKGASIVELDYLQGFSMTLMVPDNPKALKNARTAGVLSEIVLDDLNDSKLTISLPKFNISSNYDLKELFTALGAPSVFTPNAMIHGISSRGATYISESSHKAVVQIDEKGSTAAAVSSIGVSFRSAPFFEILKIDRPFVFVIRDNLHGITFFAGIVRKL